jgi:hypothetical protein
MPKIKYKIRDMTTNLYQGTKFDRWTGQVEWSKRGKTWKTFDELKKHLNALEESKIQLSSLWEVIEIDAESETDCSAYPASVLSKKNKVR